jgi:Tfp pilus assembly protein PilO
MQKNDMNLYDRYNDLHKERSNKFSLGRIYIAILIAVFLILGALTIQFMITESTLKSKVKNLNEYNESAEVATKMAEVATLKENLKALDEILLETKSINTVFASAVRINSFTMDILRDSLPRNVGFDSVSYSSGIVSVDIHGTRASDISNYILRLESLYYFKSITTSGYIFDTASGKYYATVRCVMKGGN